MKKLIAGVTVVLAVTIILNSCTLNNSGSTTTTTQQGSFLVAQASPDAKPLTVTINGSTFDTGFTYGRYTPYVRANPGTYDFSITASGNNLPSNTTTLSIEANKSYSLFYIDSFATIKTALVNDVFKAPSGDSVYIRFFNFCPNLTQPINLIDTAGSIAFSQNRTFNDQSVNPQNTAFTEEHAGIYTFRLQTISGTVLKTKTVTLTGGKVYTLIAKGINGSMDSTKALSIGLMENYSQLNSNFTF